MLDASDPVALIEAARCAVAVLVEHGGGKLLPIAGALHQWASLDDAVSFDDALGPAAHHKLPMTCVAFNNGGYRIIKQRLKLFHSTDRFIGMDFTDLPIKFAALAAVQRGRP